MAELDYRIEAGNLRLLGSHLAGYERLVVPQPIDGYTTASVLTMELVDGRNIGSLGPLALHEVDGTELAVQLFDAYLDQILVHGFFHADPHPGNVLLTHDGRLGLIDLGMVARVSGDLQDALLRLLIALNEGKGNEVAAIMASLGEQRDSWDPSRFEREIVVFVQRHESMTIGQLEAGPRRR